MRLLERRFAVDTPIGDAWAHLARVEDWQSWARHIRRIELTPPGELTPASTGVIRLAGGLRSTFRMTELHPGASWKWTGRFLWLTIDYDHRFRSLGPERTEIEFTIDGEGFAVGAIGPVFAAIYARSLDLAIPLLVEELESR